MAVKRLIITLDDSDDIAEGTTIPQTLVRGDVRLPQSEQETTTPDKQDDYEEPEENVQVAKSEVVGRTPSDLVVAYINRPELIATSLTFFSFFICVGKLDELKNFWIPISMSAVLNAIWFGIYFLRKKIEKN